MDFTLALKPSFCLKITAYKNDIYFWNVKFYLLCFGTYGGLT
jgi:hypothetical protein